MAKITISAAKIAEMKRSNLEHFPKYTTYLINQAAQTAQATRPSVVGQLSNEYPLYVEKCKQAGTTPSLEGWKEYHKSKFPTALENAVKRTDDMIVNFKEAINQIDDELIEEWVLDLLYDKTFYGFNLEATIKMFLTSKGLRIKDADASDESKNIDLYINERPYQIKPDSIEYKQAIKSKINIPLIVYRKEGNNIIIEFDDDFLKGVL